ncbi:hypothetical protein F5Y14DRAFT_460431 [Nemania sp. NC0429]|nr:hypothetical protein F5Y14DRAFT_460431 [Nemania sp. NC0429]
MPPSNHSLLAMQEDSSLQKHDVALSKPPGSSCSGYNDPAASSGSSTEATSSDEEEGYHGSESDYQSSTSSDSRSVSETNGSGWTDSSVDEERSELAPEDSVSMRNTHRRPFPFKTVLDEEGNFHYGGDDDSDICSAADKKNQPQYEDRLTRLGYVKRLPDMDELRHYHVELAIDKSIEEDKVRFTWGSISLSSSGLPILNSDGLQPKLASDLEGFSNDFLEIKKSPVSGYGAFAVCDLAPFTPILIEQELFSTNARHLYKTLASLTEEQRKAYHNLHGHKRTPSEHVSSAIWHTNRFSTGGPSCSIFLVASRFNHACDRYNVEYAYNKAKRCMAFVTKSKIAAGSELFIRYTSHPKQLFDVWGFRCACSGCKAAELPTWDENSGW